MHRTIPVLVLSGCVSDEFIASEMERALVATHVALVGGMLSAEILSQVHGEPDELLRHGSALCGCPCLTRIGPDVPYVVQLDYATEGCIPTSGYLPSGVTGDATVDYDGAESTVTWSGLLLGMQREVEGPLSASKNELDEGVLTLRVSGDLSLGAEQVALDLSIVADSGQLRMDGEAVVAGEPASPLTLDGVVLPYESIWKDCAMPVVGTVSTPSRNTEAIVTFSEAETVVHRKDRVSQAADWCAYRPEIL